MTLERGQLRLEAAALSKSCQHHRIGEKGFEVTFDGKAWIARWEWMADPHVRKRIAAYRVPAELRDRFNDGIRPWISEGWLVHWEGGPESDGPGLIPLMVVEQITKGKA